jgi:membrane protein
MASAPGSDPADAGPPKDRLPAHETEAVAAESPGLLANAQQLTHFVLQRAGEKKLTQVASSLTFTTVLSLVPLLAIVLALFTAFPLFSDFRLALEDFLTASLLPGAVSQTVMQYLNQFAAQASRLTAVGSLFLIVTSIMLIMTVDEALNDIWQVKRQRPFRSRILVYWAIISMGPILAGATLWTTSLVARESLDYMSGMSDAVGVALSFLIPLVVSGVAFTALFVAVPNRRVLRKDALIGGFGVAIILEFMKAGFGYYLARFPSYTVIYGAFATLPIFLLWLYLSWLVILVGATVASLLPALRQRRWAYKRQAGACFVDAVHVLKALWASRSDVAVGRKMSFLCAELQIHQDELEDVLAILKQLGYVVDTQDKDADLWVLACDSRRATLGPLIDALLIDRNQADVFNDQYLLRAVAASLLHKPVRLEDFFERPQTLPQSDQMGQNTIVMSHVRDQEDSNVESQ